MLIKSPEEGLLDRPKYRETSSRFSLCIFVINFYIFYLSRIKQEDYDWRRFI